MITQTYENPISMVNGIPRIVTIEEWVDNNFNFEDIFNKLPKKIFSSEYLGDLTLENILYDVDKNKFFIIDQSITEYDSYVFDIAKLKQDTVCQWFIRNDLINLDKELNEINDVLSKYEYYNNDYLLIIMLMRVLPYCKNNNERDWDF